MREPGWAALAGAVLGAESIMDSCSFVALGGTSLQAIELLSLGQRQLSLTVDIARLLGPEPLPAVLDAATPYVDPVPQLEPDAGRVMRDLLPGQRPMLAAHLLGQDRPYHLMFTLEATGLLHLARVEQALCRLVARHESLRTMFVAAGGSYGRIVLGAAERPRLLHLTLPTPPDRLPGSAVSAVHDLYGRAGEHLLRPFDRPPLVFVLTRTRGRHLLTLLAHHVIADGWSIGVLWREFTELYCAGPGDRSDDVPGRPSPEQTGDRLATLERSGALAAALERGGARLAGAPTSVSLPTDLPRPAELDGRGTRLTFALSPRLREAADGLARRCAVTVTTVLMSAWALVVARRTGLDDLLLGIPAAGRFDTATLDAIGLYTRVVPVRCRVDDDLDRAAFVRGIGDAVARAVADADVPFERLVAATGEEPDPARNPLVQVGFAAHHELIPGAFEAGGRPWKVYEGHCHGSVFDALLYLQTWSTQPRLTLEYADGALTATDAGDLIESLETALSELAEAPHAPLAQARTISPEQQRRLAELGAGTPVEATDDIWSAFARVARKTPDALAVRDCDGELTYRQLHAAAVEQSRLLSGAGVRAGDRVALDLRRSVGEAIAVLAVLRLGACYVAVDRTATAEWHHHVAATAAPRACISDTAVSFGAETVDCPLVSAAAADADRPPAADVPPAAPADGGRAAYVSFTSGSTGVPKGVVVPHRAVLRLAADEAMVARSTPVRMLRLAPLAFDASTLELLVPLVRGDTVEVYPPEEPTPAALTAFLLTRPVTHAWLTSGLFHLVADHRPDAFGRLRQLFTGGGTVSPEHVRRVLDRCPELRVTNGYGPTENTTFTTTFHVDAAHEVGPVLPIGRPVAGTEVVVADRRGRPVPPGGIGELHALGLGLADGYLNDTERTAAAFVGRNGSRAYHTGDLVRWGSDGQLRFLGRTDRQVKIAGHRVELADVERRIKGHASVLDAVVFAVDGRSPRLCAAVKLHPGDDALAAVRGAVEAELAPYARPQRWTVVDEFPLNRNGKVNLDALAAAASSAPVQPAAAGTQALSLARLEQLVADAWTAVLGTDDFDVDEAFFDVGGDSLRLAVVRKHLRDELGGHPVPLTDLYRFPTVQALAGHLHALTSGAPA